MVVQPLVSPPAFLIMHAGDMHDPVEHICVETVVMGTDGDVSAASSTCQERPRVPC